MTGYLEAGPYRANQDGLIGRDRRTLHPSVLKAGRKSLLTTFCHRS
jgi:hypothetical protein